MKSLTIRNFPVVLFWEWKKKPLALNIRVLSSWKFPDGREFNSLDSFKTSKIDIVNENKYRKNVNVLIVRLPGINRYYISKEDEGIN